jgi:hypothetical protein
MLKHSNRKDSAIIFTIETTTANTITSPSDVAIYSSKKRIKNNDNNSNQTISINKTKKINKKKIKDDVTLDMELLKAPKSKPPMTPSTKSSISPRANSKRFGTVEVEKFSSSSLVSSSSAILPTILPPLKENKKQLKNNPEDDDKRPLQNKVKRCASESEIIESKISPRRNANNDSNANNSNEKKLLLKNDFDRKKMLTRSDSLHDLNENNRIRVFIKNKNTIRLYDKVPTRSMAPLHIINQEEVKRKFLDLK